MTEKQTSDRNLPNGLTLQTLWILISIPIANLTISWLPCVLLSAIFNVVYYSALINTTSFQYFVNCYSVTAKLFTELSKSFA